MMTENANWREREGLTVSETEAAINASRSTINRFIKRGKLELIASVAACASRFQASSGSSMATMRRRAA